MKILVLAPTPFFADRGCHIRIYEEAKALQEKGHNVDIFTYHNGRDIEGLNIHRIINIPWYKKLSAGPSWHKLYLDVLLMFNVMFLGFFKNYDVIHAHLHEGCIIGFFLKIFFFFRPKLIFDAQGSLVGEMSAHGKIKNNLFIKIFTLIERFTLSLPDHIVCSSIDVKNYFAEKYKVDENRMSLLEDATDRDLLKMVNENDVNQIYNKFKIPKDKKIIIYTGGLSEYKGVDYLLNNFAKLVKERENLFLLIIGYPDVDKYKKLAEDLNIANQVCFTGKVNYFDLFKFLTMAAVAVDPKLEGSMEASGKIVNYMTANLPIVVRDTEKNKQYLGESGFYFTDNINDKIIQALENKNIKYKNLVSWRSNIDNLIKVYNA